MARIFISYSSKNKELVSSLAQDIETAGYQIWFDHKLTGGQSWWDQILENIRQCDVFIFALTPDALDSYPCQLEYTYAHQLGRNMLPVLVADGVSVALLPPELTTIQFVDYRTPDRQAAFKLMSAFTNLPAPKPLPDPLPDPPPVPISYIGNLKEQIDIVRALSFDEQASLVLKLKEHFQDEDNRADAVTLLERLKKRDDLFAKIENEIDAVLASVGVSTERPNPAPPVAPPKVNKVVKQQADVAPGDEQSAESGVPRRLLWQLIICEGLVWGSVFLLGHGADLSGYGQNNDKVIIFSAVAGCLVSGLTAGLILRQIEPQPREVVTQLWLLKTALMGGPLNALLVRRIVPTVKWWQVLEGIVGWGIGAIVAALITFRVRFDYDLNVNIFLFGALTGIFGAVLIYFILKVLRRSQ